MSAAPGLLARLAAIPAPVRFGFWMVMSGLCFAALLGLVRFMSERSGMDVFVISFWRNALSILVFLPWLVRHGLGVARSRSHGMLVSRATLMTASSTAMFFSAALMPLAEATAISFTTPLFSIILAMIFLGERVGPRRLVALAVGLLGVVIILRPGVAALSPAAGLPLLAALTFGGVVVLSKALFYWSWPAWGDLPWLLALAAAAVGNMYFITRAVRIGDASQTAPYDSLRLPFVALVGYAFFSQTVDLWVWLGAAVILSSTIYVTLREAQVHRSRAKG